MRRSPLERLAAAASDSLKIRVSLRRLRVVHHKDALASEAGSPILKMFEQV